MSGLNSWQQKLYAGAYGAPAEVDHESHLEDLELYERARQGLSDTLHEEES